VDVFAIRHGETAWSLNGQHTGTTDIPLTDSGRRLAERMRSVLAAKAFELVLCSPMHRARETCELAGLGNQAMIDPDLLEWNYGEYEGLTPQQIRAIAPGWLIFQDGCPGGETPAHVGARVGPGDRTLARCPRRHCAVCARTRGCACSWRAGSGCPPGGGQHFLLNTGTLCVLSYYREIPAVRTWNGPLLD
jgi:probable phosphoglycerate mutase